MTTTPRPSSPGSRRRARRPVLALLVALGAAGVAEAHAVQQPSFPGPVPGTVTTVHEGADEAALGVRSAGGSGDPDAPPTDDERGPGLLPQDVPRPLLAVGLGLATLAVVVTTLVRLRRLGPPGERR